MEEHRYAVIDENHEHVTMPAGRYWVGDPCYGVPDEKWQPWLDVAWQERDRSGFLLGPIDGYPTIGISTAHGDGTYDGDDFNQYPVDAGLIGAVPVEVVGETEIPFGMHLYVFHEPFQCSFDELYGVIHIGHVEIMTDPPEEEPEEEDDRCGDPYCTTCYPENEEERYPTGEDL